MKRFAAMIFAAAMLLCLSPAALAATEIEKPAAGQVIFIEANNNEEYVLTFPLSSLSRVLREGDDLRLEFPASKMTFRDFFLPRGDWRSLSFSDGRSVGGADFDSSGRYTGVYTSVLSVEKGSQVLKQEALSTGKRRDIISAQRTQSGLNVLLNGSAVYAEQKNLCLEAVNALNPQVPDWKVLTEERYEFWQGSDGSLRPVRAFFSYTDGISISILNPQAVLPSGSLAFRPVSPGRATALLTNSAGQELAEAELRCISGENGQLSISCLCPVCSEEQGGELHLELCGHYSCEEGYSAAEHRVAECSVAGHCVLEGEHSLCQNCRGYVCDGNAHGFGLCKHVHNWVAIGPFTSKCTSCGYVYTSPGKG